VTRKSLPTCGKEIVICNSIYSFLIFFFQFNFSIAYLTSIYGSIQNPAHKIEFIEKLSFNTTCDPSFGSMKSILFNAKIGTPDENLKTVTI
jgi:hypothetical protein